MPVYRTFEKMGLLKWDDMLEAINEYGLDIIYANSLGLSKQEKDYLFELLNERFAYSTFRYTDIGAAVAAMVRTMRFAGPELLEKERLYKDLYAVTIDDLIKQRQQVRNLVEKPNIPGTSTDKKPFNTLSNEQETITTISGHIEELQDKWRILGRNAYDKFYEEFLPLFTVILVDSDSLTLYPKEN